MSPIGAADPTGNTSYSYDKTGNMTGRNAGLGPQTLEWNAAGQLVRNTSNVGVTNNITNYIYDADGNLLLQKDPGNTILYLDGQQIALNTTTNTATGTRYYPLPDGTTAVRTGSGTNYGFNLSDPHGTADLRLDYTAQTATWRQFTPYGEARGAAVTWNDNRGFLNKPINPNSGLTQIGARNYDPALGRFVSLDPILDKSDLQQLNGYSYSASNPITYSDPTGLFKGRLDGGAAVSGGGVFRLPPPPVKTPPLVQKPPVVVKPQVQWVTPMSPATAPGARPFPPTYSGAGANGCLACIIGAQQTISAAKSSVSTNPERNSHNTPQDDEVTGGGVKDGTGGSSVGPSPEPIKVTEDEPEPEKQPQPAGGGGGAFGGGGPGGGCGGGGGGDAPDDGEWADPLQINFSQRTIASNDYVESMLNGTWDWDRPGTALRVIDRDGQLVSYDNRRLDAAREVASQIPGYQVKVVRVDPNSPNPAKTSGMSWDQSFEKRMTSKRNRDANGCRVPRQGLFGRPGAM